MRLDKKYAISALAVILLVLAAFYVFAGEERRDRETSLEEIDRLNEVLTRVLDFYVDEKELGDVVDDAIRGILEELDPHSVYLDKRQYENLMSRAMSPEMFQGVLNEMARKGMLDSSVAENALATAGMRSARAIDDKYYDAMLAQKQAEMAVPGILAELARLAEESKTSGASRQTSNS